MIPWFDTLYRLGLIIILIQNISTTTGSKGQSSFIRCWSEWRKNGTMLKTGILCHIDMQMVSLTLRVMSRPDLNQLPRIYQNLGQEWVELMRHTRIPFFSASLCAVAHCNPSYDERVLPSIGNEVLKATVAQFDGMLPLFLGWLHTNLWIFAQHLNWSPIEKLYVLHPMSGTTRLIHPIGVR